MFDQQALENIEQKRKEWEERAVRPALERRPEEKEEFETYSGIPMARLYTPSDVKDQDYLNDLGFPGMPPYTRGIYPTMYRGRFWTTRQLAGFGTPEDCNRRLKFLLEQGANGLNLVFDYPTLRGYDSDNPLVKDDVGHGGVAIDSLSDMETVFDGIPLDKISTSLIICNPSTAITILAMFLLVAQGHGIKTEEIDGGTQNDFMMETVVTHAPHIMLPEHSFKMCCDIIEYCTKYVPKWHPVGFVGYNIREIGTNAIQELAFVISHAKTCVKELVARGLDVDSFAPSFSFFMAAHNDFFEEIAKYRAARRIWCKIMKEEFRAKDPRSYVFRFHAQTAGSSLTAQQPLINTARVAIQALAAVLGGVNSLHCDAYDEALSTPSELSATVALRTQQIIQYETNVAHTTDPLGGSYYLEHLTNELEKRVFDQIAKIDELGGMVTAVEKGWIHGEILRSAYEYHSARQSGELKVVGFNCFKLEEEPQIEISRPDPKTAERQAEKLASLRRERDDAKVAEAVADIAKKCENGENLMPAVLQAVDVQATIGEITDVLRRSFGAWTPPFFG